MEPTDFYQDPYTVYLDYCRVKVHFTTVQYNLKKHTSIRNTRKSFDNRKDQPFFYFLAKRMNRSDNFPFFIAQFVEAPYYIGDLILEKKQAMSRYSAWINRMEHLQENFTIDLWNIVERGDTWKSVLDWTSRQHPKLFQYVIQHRITAETYVFIDLLTDFIQKSSKALQDTLYTDLNLKYSKYKLLLDHISKESIISWIPEQLTSRLKGNII